MLSFLATNSFTAEVKGINDLQAEYETLYGPGNYIPPVEVAFGASALWLAWDS
jgi:cytochrome d ubiquinol oxidase subunit I